MIAENLCYTKLVYQRINKKLAGKYTKTEIKILLREPVLEATQMIHKGKNFYIYNNQRGIRITVNVNNYRVITVDKWVKVKSY
ncbi:DUF3781 domain-containing protein [Liquorilactobacillus capillatus]|uniref:DUF3781 domain-containing protein n=1 Tax=Liquorilactobacillus capillatus DSM 19910 TaxID=1423731 RepID=A0A0R1M087_9LACO|nr:DUF3781 domain-containing protein [Liquorilactobacillus capillatus]KRL00985.1 hypothetical protein FC81_GL001587 [Liquorilactobacillus capillatus DSM 19910]